MSEQNKTVIKRLVECWNEKPAPAAMAKELYDANCTVQVPGGTCKGHAGIEQFIKAYFTAFPDVRCVAEDILADGDKVVLRWRCTGTHRGPLQGIAATGRHVDVPGTAIYRLAGGKIVDEISVWDTLFMMQQIGVVDQIGQARGASQ
jgi:steroid delta-isomerase-like uncharacterized protein